MIPIELIAQALAVHGPGNTVQPSIAATVKSRRNKHMTTEAIKDAIYAEMVVGHNLLEAKLIVLRHLSDRVDVAADELKASLGH